MKPWHWITLYRRVDAVGDLMQEATVKSLWRSKTFYFNLLTALAEVFQFVTQYQLLPPGVTVILINLINIGLRMTTTTAVTLKKVA